MPDVFPADTRSRIMSKVRGKDTAPEKAVRSMLHRAGFRFRLHRRDLPGKPDIVLPKYKTVIFVHGCFWHQHTGCPAARRPSSNTDYWDKKLDANVNRDIENKRRLRGLGWQVMVVWECQIKSHAKLKDRLASALHSAGGAYR